MGQRSISQLRFLDFIIALTLGNILAHPLSDESLGLEGSMITTAVLVVLYVAVLWLSLKWPLLKRYLDPPPIKLVENGKVQIHNLAKARVSIEFLFSELRKEKVEDIRKIALAIWEPGGTVSIFMETPYQPLTPSDMQVQTQPFSLIRPIIFEGVVDKRLLKEIGKDYGWLERQLTSAHSNIRDVGLATIDDQENIQVYSLTSRT
jgi:uncharacterized membrane protein YcaP (DUF421 family)